MKTFVLGSINMDLSIETDKMPLEGETIHGKEFFSSAGGKGANQATTIGKLGGNVCLIGCTGDDQYGKELLKELKKNKVKVEAMKIKSVSTGVAIIILSNGDNRIIIDAGANQLIDSEMIARVLDQKAHSDDIFLTQLENNLDAVYFGLRYAKALGMYTIFNPAPMMDLDQNIYSFVDLLILNQTECEQLTNKKIETEADIMESLKSLKEQNLENVILTLGAKGAMIMQNDKIDFVEAEVVKAVDTTAAGDAFIGAICSELAKGKDLVSSARFASKISAITVTRKGAQSAIPTLQEYKDIYERR